MGPEGEGDICNIFKNKGKLAKESRSTIDFA